MLAVVKIAGQQFKIQAGDSLYVPHLQGKTGDKLDINEVLLLDNEGTLAVGKDAKAIIKAEIVNDLVKDQKVLAYKFKRRKGFRKLIGHRTQFTELKINSIEVQ